MADLHFYIGSFGTLLYVIAMWVAGITQGLMWRAENADGGLLYPNFVETLLAIRAMYWMRLVGGLLYLAGFVLCVHNLWKTARAGQATDGQADVMVIDNRPAAGEPALVTGREALAHTKNVPYTPLELEGRDVYLREGCYNCHSQMIRPFAWETARYGEVSREDDSIFDHPFQWGSKRTGPDLARIGGKYSDLWHYTHLIDPRAVAPGSNMPSYGHLSEERVELHATADKLRAMRAVGVPYGPEAIALASDRAAEQARDIAQRLQEEGGPEVPHDSRMVALIGYLQCLGRVPAQEAVDELAPIAAAEETEVSP